MDLNQCWCAGADSPDDMMLGLCFKHLGIIPVHSPYFHQVCLKANSSHIHTSINVYVM